MADPYERDETPWRDPEVLKNLYQNKGLNTYEIADELDTSDTTVQKWLDEHGIKEKNRINKERPWRDEELMERLYEEKKLMIPEIADQLDCAYQTVHRWLKKHGIERRDRHEEKQRAFRKSPPSYRTEECGYEVAETTAGGPRQQIRIHRLVAVAEHGIDSVKDRIVHHKNGIPWDNRRCNLEIMTNSEHGRIHAPAEVRWGNQKPADALEGSDS